MFDFVRSHTRLLQGILLLLIVPSFVLFGVEGYNRFTEGGNAAVAKVDGQTITQQEWDAAHMRQIERVSRQMPGVDPKLFDTPEAKRETLEQLLRERVLLSAAHRLHLTAGDERVQRELLQIPQVAALRKPDGAFDVEAYKALLGAQGMTPETFEARVRQELTLRRVAGGIEASVLASSGSAQAALDALLQRREVQVQRFDAEAYKAKVTPGDAELEAYYKAHADVFRTPEQARIEYVVLDLDTLQRSVSVSDAELRQYYEENLSRYTSAEERRASHVLVKAEKDQPAAERDKARAKAEALLAELRRTPARFAEIAKKNSDDPGSAERGGDLDFFGRGAMVKPFEDAAFAMKPGEISPVVETDFGFHIIRLDAVRGGDKKPFESVRAEIEDEVKKQLAQKKYAEAAEQFSNTVYEQPDSLQPVADKLKLSKQSATVQRNPLPGASGALASAKLLEAVFGSDAVQNKRNTDAVEVGPSQLAAARVLQHLPASTRPLAEVSAEVRERVVAEQAAAQARKDGEARLAQLKQGGDAPALPAALTVSRAEPQGLPQAALDAVLRADAGQLPATLGVALGAEGYVVLRVNAVKAPQGGTPELAQLKPRYAQAWAAAEGQAYYAALKERFKAELKGAAAASAVTQ
jgi:peptidyl-prolyl cis-trans isomerase D